MAVWDDGGGAALYVGGFFTSAGGVSANRIARWDGASWSALGAGMNDAVNAFTVFDDGGGAALYAGGGFTTAGGASANCIAKWNGSSWSALGTGLNNVVYALTVFDDGGGPALYAGGFFDTAGGVSAIGIAKWNGLTWSAVGAGVDAPVQTLTVFDDGGGPALYAGGFFTNAGGGSANYIAQWDGASWSALGSGLNNRPYSLTVFDDGGGPALYAGGLFTTAGGGSANQIARWDGASWSALGSGTNHDTYVLTVFNDGGGPALYAGGYFTAAGGETASRIAKWDGSNWSALGSGLNAQVNAFALFNDGDGPALYAGGDFSTAGGLASKHLAKWFCTPLIFVNAAATGANDGTSWADAFVYLQDALVAATPGTEVWVADGVYRPDHGQGITLGDRTATFQLIDGVEIYGGFLGTETSREQRDWGANETILDGDLSGNDAPLACTLNSQCAALGGLCFSGSCIIPQNNGENSFHVVTGSFNDATAVLDGFTIRGGNADGTGALLEDLGAGIFNNSGSPTLSNCLITGNSAESAGGGMVNLRQSGNPNAEPVIRNCMVIGNAGALGGGMYAAGGASVAKVSNCTFMANVASGSSGGGAMVMLNAPPVVFNSAFIGNVASTGDGGAVANLTAGTAQFTNCTFSGNTAGDHGGAFYISTGSPVLTNCTFSANTAPAGAGGGLRAIGGSGLVRNSIFWGNTDDGSLDASAQIDGITPSYSIVQFYVSGGAGNSGANPLLVDFDGVDNLVGTSDDDLRLSAGSSAIDTGNSTLVPVDTLDLDGDSNSTERASLDLSGEPRFRDNMATPDTGVADPPDYPVVDKGAYEYIPRLYVDADAAGANNGSSWANAYIYLQDALTAAVNGTEVWVAEGIYRPDRGAGITLGDRTATFQLQSGVALYGGFAGDESELDQRDIEVNPTILSGDLASNDGPNFANYGENSFHVLTLSDTTSAIVDGFLITSGYANGTVTHEQGAGLYIFNSTSIIENCRIQHNATFETEGSGGGANGAGVYIENSDPQFTNCVFGGNRAFFAGQGGAVICLGSNSQPVFSDCDFLENAASNGGGAIYVAGGADPTFLRCNFARNSADGVGGALCIDSGETTAVSCRFAENTTLADGGAIYDAGGGAYIGCFFFGNTAANGGGAAFPVAGAGEAVVVNSVFSGNSAASNGGAIASMNGIVDIVQCSVSGNSAGVTGGGLHAFFSNPDTHVVSAVFWANTDSGGMDESAQLSDDSNGDFDVNHSVVQGLTGGLGGTGNLSTDPLFEDPNGADNIVGTIDDDLRLRAGSPAIDAGDSTALPLDALDLDGDLNTSEYIPFDLAGNPRLFDDPDTADTGIADPIVVDMGAYEYFSDCNNNGVEDSVDITEGTSQDCDWGGDANDIPDECDIADCPQRTCVGGANAGTPCSVNAECESNVCSDPAFADCADCNLNGIPDDCDIYLGSSSDVAPADGVPDECANFTGGCTSSNQWSCFDNWDLPGDDYPDNDMVTYSVVLNGTADAVCLDVPVEIDSLNLVNGSSLAVTQPDPPCDGAVAARGPTSTTLDVVAGGLVVQDSSLTVSADNVINVSASMMIGPGGSYTLDAAATSLSSAVLNVSEIRVIGSDCGTPPCPDGGMMDLTHQMEVHTTGDLIVDGSLANGECDPGNRAASAAFSFHTPPIKRVRESAVLEVGGNLTYAGAANVVCNSTEPVIVAGDFDNQSVRPDCFDYVDGSMRMTDGSPHMFEVAAVDVGPVDMIQDAQFPMGSLTVGTNASVTFADNFDNDLSGQGSCTEALYVGTLTLEAGASIVAKNCRIYYEALAADETSSVQTEGCGEIREIQNPAKPSAVVGPGGEIKNRFVSFGVPMSGAGSDTVIRAELTSLHHPAGPANAPNFSAFEGQYRYLNAMRDGANNPVFICADSEFWGIFYNCAKLGCTPEYRDWAGIFGGQVVHVTGDSVVPSSQYAIVQLAASCAGSEANCTAVSAELIVSTERWGNVDNNPPGGAPGALDIARVVDKVKDILGAFTEPRCQLRDATPNPFGLPANAQDIARAVDAVKGRPYPFTISACP